MNQLNVQALEAILQEHAERTTELMQVLTLRDFAEFLASHGVLVPSVLTDEESVRAMDLGWPDRMAAERFDSQCAAVFRYELEKLAKGGDE